MHEIAVVGLGPGAPELLTIEARAALTSGAPVFWRTRRHPVVDQIDPTASRPSFDDLDASRDGSTTVDTAIVDRLLRGYGRVMGQPCPSETSCWNPDVEPYEYDPEKAVQILEEAGWTKGSGGIREKDGKPLMLSILSSDFAGWGLYNQIIQEQLKKIGIDSEISTLEWNAYLDQWRENQGDWNITYHSQGSIVASVSAIQASWAPESYWSITQIDDATTPDLQQLATDLQALSDDFDKELDPEKRKDIAKQAQTLFQENQLTVWLWHGASLMAIQPKLTGYTLSHSGRIIELDKASFT